MKLFSLIINLLLILTIQKYLQLNLERDNDKNKQIIFNKYIKNEDIMQILFNNDIFTLINIGKPKKEIKLFFTFSNNKTILNNNIYSKAHSITYKYNNITNKSFELFEFNDKIKSKIKNYSFDLLEIKGNKPSNKMCTIGLSPIGIYNDNNSNTNFLLQLQKNGLINKKIFSIIYNTNIYSENTLNKEKLIIGDFPEELYLDKFSKNNVKWCKLHYFNNKEEKWSIFMDSFSNFNIGELKNIYIEFILENNLIIGPESFRVLLLENFLNKLMNEEICKEDYFYNDRTEKYYLYYECNKIDTFQNKNLYFKNKELNETFAIDLGDLFYRYDKKLFFGIIFENDLKNENENQQNIVWKMGKIFYEKYYFIFDDENKRIGYYKIVKDVEHPFIIFLCFILFFFFVFLLILYGYFSRKKKIINDSKNKSKIKDNINKKDSNFSDNNIIKNNKEKID